MDRLVGVGGGVRLSLNKFNLLLTSSVGDPADPHVFGTPGSGSINPRYESGSGSFFLS